MRFQRRENLAGRQENRIVWGGADKGQNDLYFAVCFRENLGVVGGKIERGERGQGGGVDCEDGGAVGGVAGGRAAERDVGGEAGALGLEVVEC